MDNVVREMPSADLAPRPGPSAAESQAALAGDRDADPCPAQASLLLRPPKPAAELVSVASATIDLLLLLMTSGIIFILYFKPHRGVSQPSLYLATALIAAILFVGVFERIGGYSVRRLRALTWQVSRILLVWSITLSILLLTAFVGRISGDYSRGWVLLWLLTSPLALIAARHVEHATFVRRLGHGSLARNIVIVGAGEDGQRVLGRLDKAGDGSFTVRGIFDDRRSPRSGRFDDTRLLGTTDDLLRLARRERIDQIVVALPLSAVDRLTAIFEKLTAIPADLCLSVDGIAERLPVRGIGDLAGAPVLEIVDRPLKHGHGLCKWVEDKLLAVLVLAFVGPLLAVIAMLIKLDSRGPVFFSQQRFGFNNNVIRVLKFRTMYEDSCDYSGAQRTVQRDPRVTRVGRILRSLSLDELPQLINVLRGDMSLVGPRPHAVAMKAGDRLYHQAVSSYPHRHRVKPGITGWAQVNGLRGEVDTLDKARRRVEYDLFYIAHWSLWLDLKILLMTVGILIARTDAY